MKKILSAFVFAGIIATVFGGTVIDRSTKVEMSISNPIPSEKTAEKELRTYLEKIFGTYTPGAANKKIIIKYEKCKNP